MSSWADLPRNFGGLVKGAERFSAEVADGSPAAASGGLGESRSTVIRMEFDRRMERYEERDASCLPASSFFLCAQFHPRDYNHFELDRLRAVWFFLIGCKVLPYKFAVIVSKKLKADRLKPVLLKPCIHSS